MLVQLQFYICISLGLNFYTNGHSATLKHPEEQSGLGGPFQNEVSHENGMVTLPYQLTPSTIPNFAPSMNFTITPASSSLSIPGQLPRTFACTGTAQSFVVGEGVSSLLISTAGGQGGSGGCGPLTQYIGAYGGYISTTISVTVGSTLYVYVGGEGGSGLYTNSGGYNGGGNGTYYTGGAGGACGTSYSWGGGGGGASDVRSTAGDLSTRLVVAGGGAGAGHNWIGGIGGGSTGGTGRGSCPAYGGSQTSGGSGSQCTGTGDVNGDAGSFGTGGNAAVDGGAGGAGYYGGGGAGQGSDGGGGGSSYSTGAIGISSQGVQRGDGYVTVSVAGCIAGYVLSGGQCSVVPIAAVTSSSSIPSSTPSLYTLNMNTTVIPTTNPNIFPSIGSPVPTLTPVPSAPTALSTIAPTAPTSSPFPELTVVPTEVPSHSSAVFPTPIPTAISSPEPTVNPTFTPFPIPTAVPTSEPTSSPTHIPTAIPSPQPTANPTPTSISFPTAVPSSEPSPIPTPSPTVSCFGGQYANTSSACASCPAGSYSSNGATVCTPCAAGTYASSPASSVCNDCPITTFSSTVGANSSSVCLACPEGMYCSVQGLAQAVACPAGTSTDGSTSATSCAPCPLNFYQPSSGSAKCIKCHSGFITGYTQSTNAADCYDQYTNFVFGSIALIFSIYIVYRYLICGRFYFVAFIRDIRLQDVVAAYKKVYKSAKSHFARNQAISMMVEKTRDTIEKRNIGNVAESTGRLFTFRGVLFLSILLFLLPFLILFYYILDVASLLFAALIIWRGLKLSVHIPFEQVVTQFFGLVEDSLSFILIPFTWLLTELANFNIDFSILNVTCLGSQAPLQLLLNLLILGVVIVTIESGFFMFWSTTLANTNNYVLWNAIAICKCLPSEAKFSKNQKVQVRVGSEWLAGVITDVQKGGSYDNKYIYKCKIDDKESLTTLEERLIRSAPTSWPTLSILVCCICYIFVQKPVQLQAGDRCEAKPTGKGDWRLAEVTADYGDDTYDIRFVDDGTEEKGVVQALVRAVQKSGSRSFYETLCCWYNRKLSVGDKCEAKFEGKGEWLPARVSALNADSTVDVEYDDSSKGAAHNVPLFCVRKPTWFSWIWSWVRVRFIISFMGGLSVGDFCEAKYQGGAEWVPGVISVDNGDGTFDIIFEDDDFTSVNNEEQFIPKEFVRQPDWHWGALAKILVFTSAALSIVQSNPIFRFLQYLIGFVNLTAFNNKQGYRPYTASCGAYDASLAWLSTVSSYYILFMAFFIVAQIFIPGRFSWFLNERRMKFSTKAVEEEHDTQIAYRRLDGIDRHGQCLAEADLHPKAKKIVEGFSFLALDLISVAAGLMWAESLSGMLDNTPVETAWYSRFWDTLKLIVVAAVRNTKDLSPQGKEEEVITNQMWKDHWRQHMPSLYRLFRHVFKIQNQLLFDVEGEDKSVAKKSSAAIKKPDIEITDINRESLAESDVESIRSTMFKADLKKRTNFVNLWYLVFVYFALGRGIYAIAFGDQWEQMLDTLGSIVADFEIWSIVCCCFPLVAYLLVGGLWLGFVILFFVWCISAIAFFCVTLIIQFFIVPFFWLGVFLTDDGLSYFYNIVLKYASFLIISMGFWTESAVRSFELEKKFKRFSLEQDDADIGTGMDPKVAFGSILNSVVGPRALLFLIFPGVSAVLFVWANTMSRTPLWFPSELNSYLDNVPLKELRRADGYRSMEKADKVMKIDKDGHVEISGTIVIVHKDDTCDLRLDRLEKVPENLIIQRDALSQTVFFQREKWHQGKVVLENMNGTFAVKYSDHTFDAEVSAENLRLSSELVSSEFDSSQFTCMDSSGGRKVQNFRKGNMVQGRRISETKHEGTIIADNNDGTFMVAYAKKFKPMYAWSMTPKEAYDEAKRRAKDTDLNALSWVIYCRAMSIITTESRWYLTASNILTVAMAVGVNYKHSRVWFILSLIAYVPTAIGYALQVAIFVGQLIGVKDKDFEYIKRFVEILGCNSAPAATVNPRTYPPTASNGFTPVVAAVATTVPPPPAAAIQMANINPIHRV